MNLKSKYSYVLLLLTLVVGGRAMAQCPSIDYSNRSQDPRLVALHWDTMVTCENPSVKLCCSTFITPQNFGNNYLMEPIPFNPPDTSFYSTAGGGAQITLTSDDGWQASGIQMLPFDFNFFGTNYDRAMVSPNGTVKFGTASELNALVGNGHPFNASANGAMPCADANFTNSIYGLFEDIDMGNSNQAQNTGVAHAGIYRAVYDTFPCRKLVVNYNAIPKYGYTSTSEAPTHWSRVQIVCYEGTNIIEVHIFKHSASCSTDGNCCRVGINKDGTAAYPATGRNPLNNQDITVPEAWRWTPVGTTVRNINWYYGDHVEDQFEIGTRYDPNQDSIFIFNDGWGGDTAILVSPSVPTYYTVRMRYRGANNTLYDLTNTFLVGVNNGHNVVVDSDTIICKGESTHITVSTESGSLYSPVSGGFDWHCDNADLTRFIGLSNNHTGTVNIPAAFSNNLFGAGGLYADTSEITVTFSVNCAFDNGCSDTAKIRLHFYNRIDDTVFADICDGQQFAFHGQNYNNTGTHTFDTANYAGCPFSKTLRLTVHHPNDTVYRIKDCKPFTWIDGNTYDETTTTPAITLQNRFGCDSVVHLHYERDNGLTALIDVVPENATLDNLHLQLKDVSLASDSRKWMFPDGRSDTIVTVYYEFPTDEDSIIIYLVAMRNYPEFGSTCYDTTSRTIYLLKESIWFPNAFTPDRDENNKFIIKGVGLITMEVDIFDRKGNFVYHYEGVDGYWDGTNADGSAALPGSYVYIAKYTNILDPRNPLKKTGTILLLR